MMPGPQPQNTPDGTEYSTTASAPQGKCSHIDVRPTGSGFVATCYYEAKTNGPQDRSAGITKPEGHAFDTFDQLVAYLGQELGAAPGAPAGAADDGGADGSDDGDQ